jgi:hypothetical protein
MGVSPPVKVYDGETENQLNLQRCSEQVPLVRRSSQSSPCMAFGSLRMIPLLRIQLSKAQSPKFPRLVASSTTMVNH